MRVGRAASTVRASVVSSELRPFMPRGGGGKIERRAGVRWVAFDRLFDILVVPRTPHCTRPLALSASSVDNEAKTEDIRHEAIPVASARGRRARDRRDGGGFRASLVRGR